MIPTCANANGVTHYSCLNELAFPKQCFHIHNSITVQYRPTSVSQFLKMVLLWLWIWLWLLNCFSLDGELKYDTDVTALMDVDNDWYKPKSSNRLRKLPDKGHNHFLIKECSYRRCYTVLTLWESYYCKIKIRFFQHSCSKAVFIHNNVASTSHCTIKLYKITRRQCVRSPLSNLPWPAPLHDSRGNRDTGTSLSWWKHLPWLVLIAVLCIYAGEQLTPRVCLPLGNLRNNSIPVT